MKKFNKIFLVLFIMLLGIGVNAAEVHKWLQHTAVDFEIKKGDTYNVLVSDAFDFSDIKFKTSKANSYLNGDEYFRVIYSNSVPGYMIRGAVYDSMDDTITPSFAAYCMDHEKKYPLNNLIISEAEKAGDYEEIINFVSEEKLATLCKSSSKCTLFDKVNKLYSLGGFVTPSEEKVTSFKNGESITMSTSKLTFCYNAACTDKEEFTASELSNQLGINLASSGKFEMSIELADFRYNKYVVSDMPNEKKYQQSLWIIEHSYPSLDIELALNFAGVDYTKLAEEIKNLDPEGLSTINCSGIYCDVNFAGTDYSILHLIPTFINTLQESYGSRCSGDFSKCLESITQAEASSTLGTIETPELTNDEKVNIAKEVLERAMKNYVYATIQYAIWAVQEAPISFAGDTVTLGDSLTGSEELNKLYQFLIKDRSSYVDYSKRDYTANLKLSKPSKESYKSTSDAEYYGPYTVTSDMALTYWDTVGIVVKEPTSGITIVDKDLKELEIKEFVKEKFTDNYVPNDPHKGYYGIKYYSLSGQLDENSVGSAEFYIRVDKSAKSTTKIKLQLLGDGFVFSQNNANGRLLTSTTSYEQTIGVGSELIPAVADTEVTLEYNAKTADTSIGTIAFALLVAFVLGYVALKFKNDPVSEL